MLNMYMPTNRASSYMQQRLKKLQGAIRKNPQ